MSRADDAYDRGLTAAQAHDYPTAIASFLAARRADPRDSEIQGALESVRTTAGTTAHVEPPLPVTARDAALLWVGVNVVVALVAKRLRGAMRVVAGTVWALCALAWCILRFTPPEYAVAAKPEVVGHAADDAESLERFRLRAGDELVVEAQRGEWLKVRSPAGELAYVARGDVISVEADR